MTTVDNLKHNHCFVREKVSTSMVSKQNCASQVGTQYTQQIHLISPLQNSDINVYLCWIPTLTHTSFKLSRKSVYQLLFCPHLIVTTKWVLILTPNIQQLLQIIQLERALHMRSGQIKSLTKINQQHDFLMNTGYFLKLYNFIAKPDRKLFSPKRSDTALGPAFSDFMIWV